MMQREDVGLAADATEHGRQAMEKAARVECALIPVDTQMPYLDGLEAARQIRRLPGHRGMPILAMTANAFDEDRVRCPAVGMSDFIAKPVRHELLSETLLKGLDRT